MTRTRAIGRPLLLIGLLGLIAAGLVLGRPAQAQEVSGVPPCSTPDADDEFEGEFGNNTMTLARSVKLPFDGTNLILCPDDDDWFGFALAEGRTVSIDASFAHASGNIDMRLHDPSGGEVRSASSTSDNESISYTPTEGGVYTLGFELLDDPDGQGNVYQLDIDIDCGTAAVVGDAFASTLIGPLGIPDNTTTGVTDCMEIGSDGVVSGLAIDLDIEHTWVGDLVVTLEHVDAGTEVVLIDRVGFPAGPFACSGTDIEVRLIDSADEAAEDSCINGDDPDTSGLSGTFRPE